MPNRRRYLDVLVFALVVTFLALVIFGVVNPSGPDNRDQVTMTRNR